MLLQAFEKVDELKSEDTFPFEEAPFKLMQADCQNLHFEDNQFDTVVDCLTLQSTYDVSTAFSEIKRVCKPEGKILIMARGQSYFPPYNHWLRFRAAKDLLDKGLVEHIDFDEFISS